MFYSNRFSFGKIRKPFFEGDDPAPAPVPAPAPAPNPTPAPQPGAKTFTQDQVNTLLAEERRKINEKNQPRIKQLEELQQTANLTQQQKEELAQQIEQLKSEYQTKEQQQATELDKLQKKYDTDTKRFKTDSDSWKTRFEEKTIAVDIYASASEYKAFNPQQIYALLRPLTKAVEGQTADGKPSGEFTSQVDFTGRDKEKNPVKLKLSVKDAVKAMTEMPELYGNLFKNDSNGGVGLHTTNGQDNGVIDWDKMSPQEYEKRRPEIMERSAK